MESETLQPHAYRPIMAGLLAGILATVLNIFFDVLFREATGFSLSAIINVATIIFATLLFLVIAGVVYALLDKFIKPVVVTYIILFTVITLVCMWLALHVNRSDNPVLTEEFRDLLFGIVIISGSLATFLVPYLVKKRNMFI